VFTQDDAHIFISEDQLTEEIKDIFSLVDEMYGKFGLSYRVVLSTKPEKYIGTDEIWENSINSLKHALKQLGLEYTIDEGAGAFYGPKIDILLKDALGREHQCGTVQMDMNLPERFDLNYVGSDNVEHRPIMLHRVIYGSLERFFGIITEHFAGKFPLWLNPEQVELCRLQMYLMIMQKKSNYSLRMQDFEQMLI
jgi:threonyl-tRNA synthetase